MSGERSYTRCAEVVDTPPEMAQSCPWVGSIHGLGWVGSRFLAFWLGSVQFSKSICIAQLSKQSGWVMGRKISENSKARYTSMFVIYVQLYVL